MGRKTRRKCIAIIVIFDEQKIYLRLDENENVINKNFLDDIQVLSKYHKMKVKENLKLWKKKKKNQQSSLRSSNNTTQFTKEFSFLDDISVETQIMNDFYIEFERENSKNLTEDCKS